MQVAPAELEEVLLTNPRIADAAVIGVDGEGTEVPRSVTIACIIPEDKSQYSSGSVSVSRMLGQILSVSFTS